jgi:hypothetical protein
MRIYVGIRKATAIAQTCVAKWIVFCETGFRGNKSKHKVYKNVVATGSAGPGRPAARTDSEGFFFLERATFTPTWMRPLRSIFWVFWCSQVEPLAQFLLCCHIVLNAFHVPKTSTICRKWAVIKSVLWLWSIGSLVAELWPFQVGGCRVCACMCMYM